MPKRSYKGDKRRREIAKKKKREEKLQRRIGKTSSGEAGEDKSYLEYLYPGGLPDELGNFLTTLVDNNRAGSLPSIAAVYHEMREESMGIVPAEITTARPMSDDLQARARATVERLTGRTVRLTCKVDQELLGGAVTQIGSTVYDGSLRTQLSTLRRKMVQE